MAYANKEDFNLGATKGPTDAIAAVDSVVAQRLAPFGDVIDHLPNPPDYPRFTTDLKNTPVEALMSLIDPIRHLAVDISEAATQISKKSVRSVGLPGQPSIQVPFTVNLKELPMPAQGESLSDRLDMYRIGLDWPAGVSASSPTAQTLLRLKTVLNMLVLGYQDPVSLAKGVVQVLVSYVQRGLLTASQEAAFATSMLQMASGQFKISLAGPPMVVAPQGLFLKAMVAELKKVMPNLAPFQAAGAALQKGVDQARKAAADAQAQADAAVAAAKAQAKQAANNAMSAAYDAAMHAWWALQPRNPPPPFGNGAVMTSGPAYDAWMHTQPKKPTLSGRHGFAGFAGLGDLPGVSLQKAAAAASNAAAVAAAAYASAKQSQAHVIAGHSLRPAPDHMMAAKQAVTQAAKAAGAAKASSEQIDQIRRKSDMRGMINPSLAATADKLAMNAIAHADNAVGAADAALGVAKALPSVKGTPQKMDLPPGVDAQILSLGPVQVHALPTPSLIRARLPASMIPLPVVSPGTMQHIASIQKAVELHDLARRAPGSVSPMALQQATITAQRAAAVVSQKNPELAADFGITDLCDMDRDPNLLWQRWMNNHGLTIMGLGGDPVVATAATSTVAAGEVSSGGASAVAATGTVAEATAPATTPDIAALISKVLDLVTKNPQLVGGAFNLVTQGGDQLTKLLNQDGQGPLPKVPGLTKKPVKPATNFIPAIAGAVTAVVLFPVLGPLSIGAGAAVAGGTALATKKKAATTPSPAKGLLPPPV